ncbi:MAG TPA: hypothetical protein VNC17_19810 [Thermoleophilaceae bacterium]|jgi:hypothetical protein|nr:hypothetical protein [Thermoleophilaceae bacterium]
MRIVCILVVAVVLTAAMTGALHTGAAGSGVATGTPVALIDLGAIFGGDENEPDENESDDGSTGRDRSVDHGSSTSASVVLLCLALGAIGALFVANRVRRLRARLRGWTAAARTRTRL